MRPPERLKEGGHHGRDGDLQSGFLAFPGTSDIQVSDPVPYAKADGFPNRLGGQWIEDTARTGDSGRAREDSAAAAEAPPREDQYPVS